MMKIILNPQVLEKINLQIIIETQMLMKGAIQ